MILKYILYDIYNLYYFNRNDFLNLIIIEYKFCVNQRLKIYSYFQDKFVIKMALMMTVIIGYKTDIPETQNTNPKPRRVPIHCFTLGVSTVRYRGPIAIENNSSSTYTTSCHNIITNVANERKNISR